MTFSLYILHPLIVVILLLQKHFRIRFQKIKYLLLIDLSIHTRYIVSRPIASEISTYITFKSTAEIATKDYGRLDKDKQNIRHLLQRLIEKPIGTEMRDSAPCPPTEAEHWLYCWSSRPNAASLCISTILFIS